ncbi:MAG: hypothetical protein P4L33_04195 [Capsulimonadaceae bacterium]|nr:hypothetical protein [Capsulimonadaceae bacterium]
MAWITENQFGTTATVAGGMWSSPDPDYLLFLNDMVSRESMTGYYPSIDAAMALKAVELFGGRIVKRGHRPKFDPTVVY